MKEIYSKDQNRKNPLSLEPGGATVTVLYKDGTTIHYDKIKNVSKYVQSIPVGDVSRISVGSKIYFENV